MPVIGDSSAVLQFEKMLPQHQAAITLLNAMLQNPDVENISWLDLACGKGQIISQLSENLTLEERKKITYHGYDINVEYSKLANRMASTLNFQKFKIDVGDLSAFDSVLSVDQSFDFITCTNVAHEIHPHKFLNIMLGAIRRLSANGQMFIYDMESLSNPELGALPLKGNDIKRLLDVILNYAGSSFKASPSTWRHRTCNGWSLVINRSYLGASNENLEPNNPNISVPLQNEIKCMMSEKLDECKRVLETFTLYGTETSDEEEQKQKALFEFWALHRILEGMV